MKKYLILILFLVTGIIVSAFLLLNPGKKATPLANPLLIEQKEAKKTAPSETFIEYADPAGFTFNYPDNLSIEKNEITDNSTYASLQLSSKDVNGSLSLKITDSKFKTLDEWLKLNTNATAKEVKLGSINAKEIKTADRLLLGALDQGIFFTIEMPLVEEEFWTKVYSKVLTDFSFVTPENTTSQSAANPTSGDVVFEGEEVVE